RCRVGDGASYRGTVSVTATGMTCQRWDSQTPHRHTMTPAKYPSLEQNYCRNPDGESGVWCYTTDPSVRWGYCNVPPCASCRVGDGASYRGTVSVTATGMTCQRWDSQTPHRHTMTPAKYPSLEQNYCRNPDGESGVWCYTTDPSVRWGYCNVPPCASCREGDGASYRGTVSVTATGKTCQRWDSQTPHKHTMTPAKYPSLEQNYCRNPDGESGVWCYTTDPSVRWGYCNVPPCASCRVGDGASYRGTVSVTATGATCQRWDSQTPHRHTMTPAKYPSLEQNYCRNPDGESGVWCYTTDPSVRWGYCNVPPCASCREGDGASYRGTVSVTATGTTCQRWDSQTPHRHTMTPAKYPSLEQNYCRNPDGESGVWCYTTDPSVRWGIVTYRRVRQTAPPTATGHSTVQPVGHLVTTLLRGAPRAPGRTYPDVTVRLDMCGRAMCVFPSQTARLGAVNKLGETWARQDAPGTTCRCSQNGTVHCEQKKCPHGELIGEDGGWESVAPGVPSCVNTTRSQPAAMTDSNLYNVNEK
ncbi:hypothetical protein Bbelb_083710, partial [Branchiostoma belcheri]